MSTVRCLHRPQLVVRTLNTGAAEGWLSVGSVRVRCALGRSGVRCRKREGDGATPAGVWTIESGYFRADRLMRPRTGLVLSPIHELDGWCDAVADRNYNRFVRHPYAASAERLWRDDSLYDLIVVLSHNRRPRVRGLGSAVFLHVAGPRYQATEGCVAVARRDLIRMMPLLRRGARLHIG
jgi:L,D-peptidoglycan transpeptidase YkuD (ErfK/YbiS/YcfS/YnhG family)